MLRPLIQRHRESTAHRSRERGVTMAIVALCMVAIISMAALSIDVGTLYVAKAEAQRAADAAALTAARIISLEGITGDPIQGPSDGSWTDICGGASSPASAAAIDVANKNLVGGAVPTTVTVSYGTSAGVIAGTTSCTGTGLGFTVNPVVQVYVQQSKLPTFFARVFSLVVPGGTSNSGVSATATAEVFNSSGSGSTANGMTPVQPRCVKPWVIPNIDPEKTGLKLLNPDGTIVTPGITQLAGAGNGVIGQSFNLNADCTPGTSPGCVLINPSPLLVGVGTSSVLQYVPAQTSGTPTAIPSGSSCSLNAGFQSAIGGCDQTTAYACGTPNGLAIDLTENPVNPTAASGDTAAAIECLTNTLVGSDRLAGFPGPLYTYPFQIQAGFGSPLVQAGVVPNFDNITTSNNIVTLPIYDNTAGLPPSVTIMGYLQVFINSFDATTGNVNVTVMNIAGCSTTAGGNPTVNGTSPVPIRLITPP